MKNCMKIIFNCIYLGEHRRLCRIPLPAPGHLPGRRQHVHLRLHRHRLHRRQLRDRHRRVRLIAVPQRGDLHQRDQRLHLSVLARLHRQELRDRRAGVRGRALPEQWHLLRAVGPGTLQTAAVVYPPTDNKGGFRPGLPLRECFRIPLPLPSWFGRYVVM